MKIMCEKCAGGGYITHYEQFLEDASHIWNEPCSVCHGTGLVEVPMTNADWIRSMSDEELAHWIDKGGFDCNMCSIPARECRNNTCYKACLEWLKKPMED